MIEGLDKSDEWLWRLLNEPLNENPWALALLISLFALWVGPLVIMQVKDAYRRREQETSMNDPTSTEPITSVTSGELTQSTYEASRAPTDIDYAAAEKIISDSRADTPTGSAWADLGGEPTGSTGEDDTQIQDRPTSLADYVPPELGGEVDTFGRPRMAAPQPGRNILAAAPVTASAAVPAVIVSANREECPTCRGAGYMPSVSDLLQESASWIDDMDGVVMAFYNRMLELARKDAEEQVHSTGGPYAVALAAGDAAVADLAHLFPSDLLTGAVGAEDSAGAGQRDKLAKALVALSKMYDPADAEQMARLDTAINSMGTRHAAFVRRDGTIKGATWEEYGLAKRALMDVLGTLPQLTRAHAEAWSQAYDYTASGMVQVQYRSGFTMPRFPEA